MSTAGEKLKAHWRSIGMDLPPGADAAEVAEFEARHGVRLPEDFRHYFLTVNGTGEGAWDEESFEWYSLAALETIDAGAWWNPDDGDPKPWFVFIDYCFASHVYAINLSPTDPRWGAIMWLGDPTPRVFATSFTEFVDQYLEKPKWVLFPWETEPPERPRPRGLIVRPHVKGSFWANLLHRRRR